MQVRGLSLSRSQYATKTTDRSVGVGLLGQPATWVRRHLALRSAAELVFHLWNHLPGALAYAVVCLLLLNHQMVRDLAWGSGVAVDRGDQGQTPELSPRRSSWSSASSR